jgi:hypothetical protein
MFPGLIEIVQNTDLTIEGQVIDVSTGEPIDLTGFTVLKSITA